MQQRESLTFSLDSQRGNFLTAHVKLRNEYNLRIAPGGIFWRESKVGITADVADLKLRFNLLHIPLLTHAGEPGKPHDDHNIRHVNVTTG